MVYCPQTFQRLIPKVWYQDNRALYSYDYYKIVPVSNQVFRGRSLKSFGCGRKVRASQQEHAGLTTPSARPKEGFWRTPLSRKECIPGMYISGQYSMKQQTHGPRSQHWQALDSTGVPSSGWGHTERGWRKVSGSSPVPELPGPAVQGESHIAGTQPLCPRTGPSSSFYLSFGWPENVVFVPTVISIVSYEWDSGQNGCEISDLLDFKRIQYSVIVVNRKEINSLLSRIAI